MADIALNLIKSIGTPAEIRAAANQDCALPQRCNCHVHLPPNFSAFETVDQAVNLAAEQGVNVLGATNYYDYSVYNHFADACRKQNIFPLYGLEVITLLDDLVRAKVKVNDPGNPGKYYLCGKGLTRFQNLSPKGRELLETIRRNDVSRMAEMTNRMARVFETNGVRSGLDADAIKQRVVRRHGCPANTVYLQERHVAQAFQEVLFDLVPTERKERLAKILGATPANADDAVAVQNDFRTHLMKTGKPVYVEEKFLSFDQGYQLVLELGGIPCYPTLADGASPICGYETPVEDLIRTLKESRIYCAELIPIRNKPDVLSQYVHAMRAAGLVVTAGTEHNTLNVLPIEPTCLKGQAVPEDLKQIFREGACVVAAHQFLTLHGECGFVDSAGVPNPKYSSTEERIAAFRKLGAAVIAKYGGARRGTAT